MTSLFLWKKKYIKELSIQLKKTGGRNNFGKIATYHRGGGTKKRYKVVNYHQNKLPFLSIIRRFEYSSNQNAYLALICYSNGLLSYILAVEGMYIGQVLGYQNLIFFDYGVAQSISNYKLGSILNNIESKQNSGGVYSRAAGTSSILLKKYSQNVLIRLSSNQLKLINNNCFATLGVISNSSFKFNKLLKAGNSVWAGRRPHVRGVAMNPVDHPHGGGEGKTSGGRCSVSPWGILTKGYPTVRGKKRKKKLLINKLF